MLARENEELRRLTTIPGVGEVTVLAVHAFAPSLDSFAWSLTKTIRARGRQGLHQEAGHTTVPDPHATLRSTSCLPTRGASTYGTNGPRSYR